MKIITSSQITQAVKEACLAIQYRYSPAMEELLKKSMDNEDAALPKSILKILLDNSEIADQNRLPMCQDTGMVVVRIALGQQVQIKGVSLNDAIHQGVKEAYDEGYLRKSIVADPLFERLNTQDNTPAVIYVDIEDHDQMIIDVAAKGFGSENMSQLKMLKPSEGLQGVKDFVLEVVKAAGPNACPPLIVGIGIGGTMDYASVLAKKALFREVKDRHPDPLYAQLEIDLLQQINQLGIGPQGLGGKTTALDVFIEHFPTHIAGLPIAVNINCHMSRHHRVVL